MARQRDKEPAILTTLRTHDGQVFKPDDEDRLIDHGLTESHIAELEARGVLTNFKGRGKPAADARGTPPIVEGAADSKAKGRGAPAPSEPNLADLPHTQDVSRAKGGGSAGSPGTAGGRASGSTKRG